MSGKKKISVLLPAELFRRFDAYCESQGYKKSPLIARLIREHMDAQGTTLDGERPARGNRTGR